MFKHIKLTTNTSSWTTCINPSMSNEEIEKYFLNKFFDVGEYPIEKMEKVTKVEFLTDYVVSFTGRLKYAIGITYPFHNIKVSGFNEDEAHTNLYNDYDSVMFLYFLNAKTNIS